MARLQLPRHYGPGFINPYNFVRWGKPFPRNITPLAIGETISHEKYSGLSGRLTCEIEVLTPLAIPDRPYEDPDPEVVNGPHQRKQFLRLKQRPEENNAKENKVCDQTALIPGASIKGMLRSVAEAVTGSCAIVLTDEMAVFRDNRNHMVNFRRLGKLEKVEDEWIIQDVHPDDGIPPEHPRNPVHIWNTRIALYRDEKDTLFPDAKDTKESTKTNTTQKYVDNAGNQFVWFDFLRGVFGDTKRTDFNEQGLPFRNERGELIWQRPEIPERKPGKPAIIRWPIKPDREEPSCPVSDDVKENYKKLVESDSFQRFHGERVPSLSKWQKKYLRPISGSFYWFRRDKEHPQKNVIQFGRNFRFKWAYDPRKAIPEDFHPCKKTDKLCPICVMFGMAAEQPSNNGQDAEVQALAGRLTIGPAKVKKDVRFDWIECLKILGEPKHSARSFYLNPSSKQTNDWDVSQDEFVEWDATQKTYHPTAARGRKFYWHQLKQWKRDGAGLDYFRKKASDHPETMNKRVKTQHNQSVEVTLDGSKFEFEITFENLREWELGLLLWTLELPDVPNGAHHLGLGKPLGLGSVKLRVTDLKLINRKKRYESLFESGEEDDSIDIDQVIKAFRSQVSHWNSGKEFASLPQVEDLFAILSLDQPAIVGQEVKIQYPPAPAYGRPVPNMNNRELHYKWFGNYKWAQRLLTITEIVENEWRQRENENG